MKKALLFFGMCVCFISTMMFGMTSAEAKIYLEDEENAYVRFAPQFTEKNKLFIGAEGDDQWNSWGFGSKSNYLDERSAFFVNPLQVQFDKYQQEGNVYRILAKDYEEIFAGAGFEKDITGFISINGNDDSEITISSTRTQNRLTHEEQTSENPKAILSRRLFELSTKAEQMVNEMRNIQITNVRPILKFDAMMVEGDNTSRFTMGMNQNYYYSLYDPLTADQRYDFFEVFDNNCYSYKEFDMPFNYGFFGDTKFFIDVDSDSLNVPTTYKFRNLRVALERFVPINIAEYDEFLLLEGIGQVLAQRIIDYRNENGQFDSIDDLQKVKGIGPATIKKIKDQGAARMYNYFV